MGDRGHVHVTGYHEEDAHNGVFLYTHWKASDLREIVADALERGRSRWSDPSYLARIILDTMTERGRDETTGFGIQPVPQKDAWRTVHVDVEEQAVEVPEGTEPIPFEEFVDAENPSALAE